jgi:uncharacterized protein (TIGR02145 family)
MVTNTFTDPRDGEKYSTVRLLDGREWFAENLRFACAGSIAADPEQVDRHHHHYPYIPYNVHKYGRLYTWEAAQAACPPGWNVPSATEWRQMLNCYGGFLVGGDNRDDQKERTVVQLQEAGFNVMTGPFDGQMHWSHFADLEQAQFWSSTARGVLRKLNPFAGPPDAAHYFLFGYCVVDETDLCRFHLSVRCIR